MPLVVVAGTGSGAAGYRACAGAIGTERSRLGNLIVDEIERFIAKAPMLHQVAQSALTLIA